MRGYGHIAFYTKLWYNISWLEIFNNCSTVQGEHMNTIRILLVALVLAILAGCATGPAPYRGDPGYQGSYGYSQQYSSDAGVRTTPCQPFNADQLMRWAGGLPDDKQHSRSAGVNVRKDGSVECTQNESASSKGVQAPQPRRAEQPPAKQVEPKKEQPEATPKPQPMKGTRV